MKELYTNRIVHVLCTLKQLYYIKIYICNLENLILFHSIPEDCHTFNDEASPFNPLYPDTVTLVSLLLKEAFHCRT